MSKTYFKDQKDLALRYNGHMKLLKNTFEKIVRWIQ